MITATGSGYVRTLHVGDDYVPPHASSCRMYKTLPLSAKVYFDPYGASGAQLLGATNIEAPADEPAYTARRSWWEAEDDGAPRAIDTRTVVLVHDTNAIPLHVRYVRPSALRADSGADRVEAADHAGSLPTWLADAGRRLAARAGVTWTANYVDVPLVDGDAFAIGVCAPGDAVAGWHVAPLESVLPASHAHLAPELARAVGSPASVYVSKLTGAPTATVPVGDAALAPTVVAATFIAVVLSAALLLFRVRRAACA